MPAADWLKFFMVQVWSLPFLLIYVCGIGLALMRWQRHPQVSLFATIGFSLFIVGVLLSAAGQFWQMNAMNQGLGGPQLSNMYALVGAARTLLGVVGWILLLYALFGWRAGYDEDQESRFVG